jgi:hypothetical protein
MVLLEKLIVAEVVKEFPAFYGTRRFINIQFFLLYTEALINKRRHPR